jgi:hypothetical protein
MIWRRWHWLDDGWLQLIVVPLLVAVVRLCWLWPWLELLRRWLTSSYQPALLPLWAIPLLFLSGTLITRAALAQSRSLSHARIWVVGSGLVALLGLLWWQFAYPTYALWDGRWLWQVAQALTHWPHNEVPPQFLTLLVTVGIWLRSVLDGRRRLIRDDVWHTFMTGVIALVLLILASQLDPLGLPPQADRWMVALVAVGLSALALSSLELSRISGIWETEKQPRLRLNRYWLVSVAFVIVALLVTGLMLGVLLTPATVASALAWISGLFSWVGALLSYLLQAVAYVIFLVLTPLIEWLQSRLAEQAQIEPLPLPEFQTPFEQLPGQPGVQLPPLAGETLRWLGLAGGVIAIIVIFALALRYFKSSDGEDIEETRETIFTRALLEEQLSSLWRRWLPRLRHPHAYVSPYLSLEGEQENRRAIRSLYQELLARAKSLGYPRARAQTPIEYHALLTEISAADESAWNIMKDEYVAARYRLQAPSTEQVEQMRQAWTHLQSVLATQSPKEKGAEPPAQSDQDAPADETSLRSL